MLAALVETLRDLGVPGLLGAVAGAVVGALIAHRSARARGREEHERTMDLLVWQDERPAVRDVHVAARELGNAANAPEPDFDALYRDWRERILAPSRLIRSPDLDDRVSSLGFVIFTSTLKPVTPIPWVVVIAALDVELWTRHWLRREPIPPARLPPDGEVRRLCMEGGRMTLDALRDFLVGGGAT